MCRFNYSLTLCVYRWSPALGCQCWHVVMWDLRLWLCLWRSTPSSCTWDRCCGWPVLPRTQFTVWTAWSTWARMWCSASTHWHGWHAGWCWTVIKFPFSATRWAASVWPSWPSWTLFCSTGCFVLTSSSPVAKKRSRKTRTCNGTEKHSCLYLNYINFTQSLTVHNLQMPASV